MRRTIEIPEKVILTENHPCVRDRRFRPAACPACGKAFWSGQAIALVPIGPGENPEAQRLCREGLAYNAACIPAHWWCVTGEVEETVLRSPK